MQAQSKPASEASSVNLHDLPNNHSSSNHAASPALPESNGPPQLDGSETRPTPEPNPPFPQPQPPYPTSFSSIVDLITRNQPIPGIEEIPDTVLEASLSPPNKTPWRRKPWEKDMIKEDEELTSASTTRNTHTANGREEEKGGNGTSTSNTWMQTIERSNRNQDTPTTQVDTQPAAAADLNNST